MNEKHIGFIGLGNMGSRMVRCLIAAGIKVSGFDIQPDLSASIGANPAGSIAILAQEARIILLSLPDSATVNAVMMGAGGLIEAGRPGQIIIDLSTAAASSTRYLAAKCQDKGIAFVDAGISGGAAAAEKGTLTLMVGGAPEAIEQLDWVFAAIAAKVIVMGESGTGHTAKLLNNFLNAVSLAATAEVMVAGKKAGLDLHRLLDVFNASSGVNFATLNRFPKIVDGDYLSGGLTTKLMTKDIVLYGELLKDLGVAGLNIAGPLASFGLATSFGYGDMISNHVVDAIGDLSGGVRLNNNPTRKHHENH